MAATGEKALTKLIPDHHPQGKVERIWTGLGDQSTEQLKIALGLRLWVLRPIGINWKQPQQKPQTRVEKSLTFRRLRPG